MKITNTQSGPRGLNAVGGTLLVDAKQTIEVGVYEREREGLLASGWFEISGEFTPNPGAGSELRPMNDDGGKDAVIADLKKQLAAKDKEIADLKKPAPKGPFEAKEKSPGWFAIFDAEGNAVGKSFREDDAKAFNVLDDVGKQKAVDAAIAKDD